MNKLIFINIFELYFFKFLLFITLSFLMLTEGCTDSSFSLSYDAIDLKVNALHTKEDNFFYRTSEKNEKATLEKTKKILENKSYSLMRGLPSTKFLGYDYPYKLSTVQMYFNSLRPVAFLTDAYFLTNEHLYLEEAILIYSNWLQLESAGKLKNRFVYYDHSVSNRVLTLIYLLRAGNDDIGTTLQGNIVNTLVEHGDWLYDDKNYNDRGNHGVMQDRALLQLGVFFNNSSYIDKASTRIKRAFKRDFSKKGVHFENSVSYARMMLKMYEGLFNLMNYSEQMDTIEKGKRYIKLLIKPNGQFPLEGDSGLSKASVSEKLFDDFSDMQSGKIIINNKNLSNLGKSDYIFFKSGYESSVHKHFDDLSFILTSNGNNVFIDSGKYNYEENDPFRKYIKSPKAHNTIFIENSNYHLSKSKYIPKITYYEKSSNYIYVQGVINILGEFLERNLIYSEGVIFLVDKGSFTTHKKMHQSFNISNDVTIIRAEQNVTSIKNGDKNLTITQHYNVDNIERFMANENDIRGFISEKFNQLIPISQIEYSISSSTPIFLTEINTDAENIVVSDVAYNVDKKYFQFSINGVERKVQISPSESLH